jgi:hypothetical protein
MIRLLLYIGAFVIFGFSIKAQENLPLKFQDNIVKWSELSWISTNIKTDQIFENRLPPIIIQDTIYIFENYIGKSSTGNSIGYAGYLIKKINRLKGEKYWEVVRTYKNGAKRKVISHPTIQNNKVKVALFDEAKSSGTYWDSAYPAQITIDNISGIIIDSNYVNRLDSSIPSFLTIGGQFGQNTQVNPKFIITDDGYKHRSLGVWTNQGLQFGIIDKYLNEDGVVVKFDTTKPLTYPYSVNEFLFFENSQNGLDVIFANQSQKWNNKQIRFLKYDDKLDLMIDIDFTEYFTDSIQYFGLSNLTNDYFILGTQFEDFDRREYEFNYHLFNTAGEFVDKLKFILRDGIDNGIQYGWIYPIVDKVNERILLTRSKQDTKNESTYFELFASVGDSVQLIKRIEVLGISDHFRTKYGAIMDNGDVLLYIEQFAWENPNVKWYSWIMLDGQKMNIISDTKDIDITSNKLKLYPNPTSSLVKISHLEIPASIKILDMNGNIIKQMNSTANEVDISDLPSGMYIFDIRNREISERHKIVKVE